MIRKSLGEPLTQEQEDFLDKCAEAFLDAVEKKEAQDLQAQDLQPTSFAREMAARAWCAPTTEKLTMIPELAEEFARILDAYIEALIWCGGSADFGEGGQAREGWKKICEPLLR